MPKASSSSVRITWPAFRREELIELLRQGVASLLTELSVTRAELFGSWAHRRATAYSDVDLLVVYAGPRREDAFATVRRHVRVRGLEPHVYSLDDAVAITGTLERMTRNAVPIYPS